MKKTIILIIATLVVSLGATATVGIVSNTRTYSADETYSAEEIDALVLSLQQQIATDKNLLDKQIETLTKGYKEKDAELLATITENQKAISALDTKYAVDVALLEKSDADNKQALDELTTAYNAKVTELETAIQTANQTIESNKTELENKITALTNVYTAKMTEIDSLLATIQSKDTTQDSKIAELAEEVTKLQNATRITNVAFSDNGDLLITFGDGSTQTVKAPEKHVHTYGDYVSFTSTEGNKFLYRVCLECKAVDLKMDECSVHNWSVVTTKPTCQAQGYDTKTCKICGKIETENYVDKIDHAWKTNYSYDNDYHWYDCATCDDVKDKAEHAVNDSGVCTVCNNLVGATAGVVYTLSSDETYYSVTDYEGTATRVRIGDKYNGLPVTKVYDGAFYGNTNISEVIIPTGVTAIGDSAFYECTSLIKIDLPNTLLSIGKNAFSESALKTITIPNSVTELGDKAFYQCTSLTDVTIGNGLKVIPYYAFQSCTNLKNVTIAKGVTSIGYNAFQYCYSLTSITIPDSVTSIGESAFSGCSKLTNITIPDSVTFISERAFTGCDKLIKKVKGVHYVDCWVVDSDKTLVKADILVGTRGIVDGAFSGCSSLTSITIPDSVTSIGSSAFSGCSSLKYNEYDNAYYLGNDNNPYVVLVRVKDASITSYSFNAKTKIIYDDAFHSCSSLTSIIIAGSVTSLGQGAFYDCSSLTSIIIPNSVIKIGNYTFKGCSSLTSITIPNSVTSIGDYAFENCSSLTSITIGSGVTSIGWSAFSGCSKLTNITIPDSVTWISENA